MCEHKSRYEHHLMDRADKRSMVHSTAIKAGALCILVVFVVSCLATGRHPEQSLETVVTHTTTSARVSMLRRGRQEAATSDSPLQQAWDEHCRRKGECGKHPQVPNRAYLINLPEDKGKLEYSQRLLGDLGFEVEVIQGVKSVQVGDQEEFTECLPAGSATDCQAGLTISHMNAWKALAHSGEYAAWIFEDDVVFHDDFLSIFPDYWASVPVNYEYIAVGMIPRHFNVSEKTVYVSPEKMPWGTHAYIVSSRQAERMALTADMMIQRSKHPVDDFHTTSWQLDGEDIKIDHYLSMYYSDLTPQDDKRRWVVFDSPTEVPFKYGNVTWIRNGGCQCSCADMAACAAEGRAPAWGMGLVAQHTCRERAEQIPIWHQEMETRTAAGQVEHCSELRACGTFVCEYERLYNDEAEPMLETMKPEDAEGSGTDTEVDE